MITYAAIFVNALLTTLSVLGQSAEEPKVPRGFKVAFPFIRNVRLRSVRLDIRNVDLDLALSDIKVALLALGGCTINS